MRNIDMQIYDNEEVVGPQHLGPALADSTLPPSAYDMRKFRLAARDVILVVLYRNRIDASVLKTIEHEKLVDDLVDFFIAARETHMKQKVERRASRPRPLPQDDLSAEE